METAVRAMPMENHAMDPRTILRRPMWSPTAPAASAPIMTPIRA